MNAASALLIVLLPTSAFARPVAHWPYEKLMQESDLVVISTVVSVVEFDGTIRLPVDWSFLVAQVTTFDVHGVLKGEIDSETLELIHCRIGDLGGGTLWNWPTLAHFELEERTSATETAGNVNAVPTQEIELSYLMFLKRRDDGRYEPVSGQVDSALSFRKVTGPTEF